MTNLRMCICSGFVVACVSTASGAPSFQGLSALPPGYDAASALDVSDDGSVVVGYAWFGASRRSGFRWTQSDGMRLLADLPAGPIDCIAETVSGNGAVIGGSGTTPLGRNACRWADGGQSLEPLQSYDGQTELLALNLDGSVGVGYATSSEWGTMAVAWISQASGTAIQQLDFFGTNYGGQFATAVDGPGIVAVGEWYDSVRRYEVGQLGSVQVNAELPGGIYESIPLALSRDGVAIAGYSGAALGYEAFLYHPSVGVRGLSELPGGAYQSFAMGMNGPGTVIVGSSETATGPEAFLWTSKLGMHRLKDLLLGLGLTDASDWILEEATSISPDGLTIVGSGIDPLGRIRPWIARVDQPFATCPADFNLNSVTGVEDFNMLAGGFGTASGATRLDGDTDGDGDVDVADFNILAGDFGCGAE